MFHGAFDAVFVINLLDRTDRRREMIAQLDMLEVGGASTVVFYPAVRPEDPAGFPSIGARGCFMSHLGILEESLARGFSRILILEDDCNFTRAFRERMDEFCKAVSDSEWSMLYGGRVQREGGKGQAHLRLDTVAPQVAIQGTHFVAFQGDSISRAVQYMRELILRPPGDPLGGPMHVDGAYSWFRRENSDLIAKIVNPQIAYQRSSRTDIHDSAFWDRWWLVSALVGLIRSFRNRVRDLL